MNRNKERASKVGFPELSDWLMMPDTLSDVEAEAVIIVRKLANAAFVNRTGEKEPTPVDAGNLAGALDLLRRAHDKADPKTMGPRPEVAALWSFCEVVERWRQDGFPFKTELGRSVRALLLSLPPVAFENVKVWLWSPIALRLHRARALIDPHGSTQTERCAHEKHAAAVVEDLGA